MKKMSFTIEELIAQTFEVEVPDDFDIKKDGHEFVREGYHNCTFILDDAEVHDVKITVYDDENEN